jgi:CTP:molybdopterin cytidylyltransferase MocA
VKNWPQTITRNDVQRALAAFRRQGGAITRLPDQVQAGQMPVGVRGAWTPDLTLLSGDEGSPKAAQGSHGARKGR